METLPKELVLLIFDEVTKITDKRMLSRTCTTYNNITKKILNLLIDKSEWNMFYEKKSVGAYTQEIQEDGYLNMIPMTYLIPENDGIVRHLLIGGQLELLKIAINNGCPLYIENNRFRMGIESNINLGIKSGNFELVHFLLEKGYKFDNKSCSVAAGKGNLEMLQYLINEGCVVNSYVSNRAALNGHLYILQWLKNNNYKLSKRTSACACTFYLEDKCYTIIKWLISINHLINNSALVAAILNSHINIVKFLIEYGCSLSERVCDAAYDNVEILQYLRDKGCPWGKYICKNAGQIGNLDVLKYAIQNGCPYSFTDIYHECDRGWFNRRKEDEERFDKLKDWLVKLGKKLHKFYDDDGGDEYDESEYDINNEINIELNNEVENDDYESNEALLENDADSDEEEEYSSEDIYFGSDSNDSDSNESDSNDSDSNDSNIDNYKYESHGKKLYNKINW